MKLEEILDEELYKQVKVAIDKVNEKEPDKLKHVRFADLSEGAYISSEKYKSLETDKGSIAEQLKTAQGLIEELKKGTSKDEGLQGKIGEYETKISELEAENQTLKTESALKIALLDAGAKAADMEYLLFKANQSGEIKLTDDGKIKGQEELVSSIKTQCPAQFTSTEQKKVQEHKLESGDPNAGVLTRSDILKKPYSERLAIYEKDPETYREIMKG